MRSQFPEEMLTRIEQSGVIAVMILDDVEAAVPLAEALLSGGVEVIELTLRTPRAMDCLVAIRQAVPDIVAGIGTVLTTAQVDQIIDAGAAFGVSPGLNRSVVGHAQQRGLPFAPGIMTPSDIEAAIELGCRELKFFPAESSGGLPQLKNMAAPYRHLGVRYVPLGGMNTTNMADYLSDANVLALGGSWLAPAKLIAERAWDEIAAKAREARKLADQARG